MFIFITIGILLITALTLLILRFVLPDFRYTWLTAAGGALAAWVSILFWQAGMPVRVEFPFWRPETIFVQSPVFVADRIAWAFAFSISAICLGVILTAVARDNYPSPVSWIGVLVMTAFGVLAVTADNPLTLVLIWAAIDLTEIAAQMRFVEDPRMSERAVISFASRVTGTMILLWASMISISDGVALDFLSTPPRAGFYLLLASAFRLGVVPLHLPYASESAFRRGFGTALRMISAGSSLILLARAALAGSGSSITHYLMIFVIIAALYSAWMWMRSPDELTGRPYWLIGLGSLAVASALRGNPVGATAWSCALILSGGALFLASAEGRWLDRILLIGVFGISSLPLSLTASGWISREQGFWYAVPFLVAAQAMLLAGYVRQSRRSAERTSFENQPIWARNVYPFGIYIILITVLMLGFFGWEGSLQFGSWITAIIASLMAFGLLQLIPRVRILNPVRAHWVRTTSSSWLDTVYQTTWEIYRAIRRVIGIFSSVLEGEGGVMWTLLFLALFTTILLQGMP